MEPIQTSENPDDQNRELNTEAKREEPNEATYVPNKTGWVIFGTLLSLALTVFITVSLTEQYGFALYLGVPVSVGFMIGFLSKVRSRMLRVLLRIILATIFLCAVLFIMGVEGVICLIMIVGPLFVMIMVGFALGRALRIAVARNRNYIIIFFVINPACIAVDTQLEPVFHTIQTSMTVNAPREATWQVLTHRVSFGKEQSFFFKNGVNYPLDMELVTKNDSSFLRCNLRNGSTDLYITKLDTGQVLRFTSLSPVVPMKELTLYDSINTPHTNSEYFKHLYGQIEIQEIDGGAVRLVATSNFSYKLAPAFYWNWWGDYLVRTMHRHVLHAIKEQSELEQKAQM
ncbi:MAG: hypothetical protein KF744_00475 [Taibaiella sp.]|nr:hypothetical protein [Taibaiella sp.]